VYHFNTLAELRRAFVDGLLYKSERRKLASLRRQRGEGAVELVRHDLDAVATGAFVAEMQRQLEALRHSLAAGSFTAIGQVPAEADVIARVRAWLDGLPAEPQIANSPRVR
jgi:hypothetical protein